MSSDPVLDPTTPEAKFHRDMVQTSTRARVRAIALVQQEISKLEKLLEALRTGDTVRAPNFNARRIVEECEAAATTQEGAATYLGMFKGAGS